MTLVQLRELDGGSLIDLTKTKITIGRGPSLKIADKRVSRNHATLEINEDNELVLVPIHTNPCYLKEKNDDDYTILERDKPHILKHKDVFSLLPDRCAFKVIYKTSDSGKETVAKESTSQEQNVNGSYEDSGSNKKSPEKKRVKHDMAMPIEKDRKLPKWMVGAANRVGASPSKSSSKGPSKPRVAQTVKAPKRVKAAAPPSDEDDEKPVAVKAKQKKKLKGFSAEEAVSPTRRPRASAKNTQYVEDIPSDDGRSDNESDFEIHVPDDSGSDWSDEETQKGKSKAPAPGRKGRAKGSTKAKGRRGTFDSEDEFSDSEEEYKPSPSKGKAKGRKNTRGRGQRKKKVDSSDNTSDDDDSDNYVPETRKGKKKKVPTATLR